MKKSDSKQLPLVTATILGQAPSLFKNIGVKGGSSHSGRRTFATRLADRGVDIEYIKYLLGHKSKQQTMAYIESNKNRLRDIFRKKFTRY